MKTAVNTNAPAGTTPGKPSRIWWWVVVAFAIQLAAWSIWLVIAARSNVQDVPLVGAQ